MKISSRVSQAHLAESMFRGAQTFLIHQLPLSFKKLKSSDGAKWNAAANRTCGADVSETGSGSHQDPEMRLLPLLSVGGNVEFDLLIQFSAWERDPADSTKMDVQETDVWTVYWRIPFNRRNLDLYEPR